MPKKRYAFLIVIAILALALLPTSCTCNGSPNSANPTGGGLNLGGIGVRSSKIAYVSDGNIYVMDANGGGQAQLTNNSKHNCSLIWSPDGKKIIFSSHIMSNAPIIHFMRNREIWSMNADGSNQTKLIDDDDHSADTFKWSPDSTKIAFTANRDIRVINPDGSGQTKLADGQNPVWSPNGSKIAFTSKHDGNEEIYAMNADGSNQTRLANDSDYKYYSPVWSPDGTKIAYKCSYYEFQGSINEMYVMNADGGGQTKLTGEGYYSTGYPVWSPDGSKIAFHYRKGPTGDIHIANADGTNYINLTNSPNSSEDNPLWSPDGTKILFTSIIDQTDAESIKQIWIMNADGSDKSMLTDNIEANNTSWVENGNKIVFQTTDGTYLINADGTNKTLLAPGSIAVWTPPTQEDS